MEKIKELEARISALEQLNKVNTFFLPIMSAEMGKPTVHKPRKDGEPRYCHVCKKEIADNEASCRMRVVDGALYERTGKFAVNNAFIHACCVDIICNLIDEKRPITNYDD